MAVKALAPFAAIFLILLMGSLAFLSMAQDSLTFDELAHIGAGYSYLTHQDYRLNPEHPPLWKDAAAVPLLFLNLKFPDQSDWWTQQDSAPAWWVQFNFGKELLYGSGNNPSQIIFWSRVPMILILLCLAWFLFRWGKELGGAWVGLGTLFLIAFSPTFLAQGRLVTNDVAAALGAAVSMYYWLQFLRDPKKENVVKAGLAFGFAMLMKFTLLLLAPTFVIMTFLYAFLNPGSSRVRTLTKYIVLSLGAALIGLLLIASVYQFHVWNYPAERQLRDTAADLTPNKITPIKDLVLSMAENPVLRSLAQYARGIVMAGQRAAFGNTVYFKGEISASGFSSYFPTLYSLKEPLAYHVINFILPLGFAFLLLKEFLKKRSKGSFFQSAISWMKENFTVISFFVFINIFWASALLGNLNIGIRHLLPIYPFSFLLLAWGAKELYIRLGEITKRTFVVTLVILGVWYGASSLSAFPHYLSYYNELAGGIDQGYKIAVDSNYDWGQDFYKLRDFVRENNIDRISLDYFGGENPEYWLGSAVQKLDPFQTPHPMGWIAVSLNQFMGGVAMPVSGYDQPSGYYQWLAQQTPVARAGKSILIFHIEK
ncbi:MAG: glycosyltransferase family 39 protein [bacterium]|nr:glycosyltransferase family 39 protein [bacterium]